MIFKLAALILCVAVGVVLLRFGLLRYRLNNWVILALSLDLFLLFLIIDSFYYTPKGREIYSLFFASWFTVLAGLGLLFSRKRLLMYVDNIDTTRESDQDSGRIDG